MAGESIPALVREMMKAKAKWKRYEARYKELQRIIPEMMQQDGLTSVKTDFGPTVYLKPNAAKVRAFATPMPGEDKDETQARLRMALESAGASHLIDAEPRVNHNSLSAWVKEELREGRPIPEDISYTTELAFGVRSNGWSPEDD